MLELTRTVRFSVGAGSDANTPGPVNGFAGAPPMARLGAHYELDATVRGDADPATGYLVDIKTVDLAVRDAAVPRIREAFGSPDPASVLASLLAPLVAALPADLARVRWRLSPYHSIEMTPDAPTTAALRQRFEFSAAHRLHVPELSAERNRELFGKCNNPSGHGHNYVIEPCVEVAAGPGAEPFDAAELERLTHEAIIRRFDHTHLNLDTEEFGEGGENPSVENIARVCFERLEAALAGAGAAATLRSVTVWETDRTCATYPAPPARPR